MNCNTCGPTPVYRTPLGTSGYGLSGAIGGISSGPVLMGQRSLGSYNPASVGRGYPSQGWGGGFQSSSYVGAPFASSSTAAFRSAPSFLQNMGASSASVFPTPSFRSYAAPMNFSAPPRLALPAPQGFNFDPCNTCDPCAALPPPPPLPLPAPCNACQPACPPPPVFMSLPPPPAPAPAPPSVIHIKDDSGPKIASLQGEIRRLERLLAGCKENEAGLRGEIGELQARLEFLANKEHQLAACEAEVAKLREQLLEGQRRLTFLEGQRDEAHKHIAFLENQLKNADNQIAQMGALIRQLEGEIANLRSRLEAKAELHSRTNVHETYKVKTFEMAAKLATMDGTDDGMYNGLPIEVEGEGLYRDLVARGRRPRDNVSLTGRPASVTTTSETYKVSSFEMAEKLSKMDGTDDGKYNGLPIEIAGQGLYLDLVRQGRRSSAGASAGSRVVSVGGGVVTASSGQQTYKVSNLEMAAKISKMGGADDGTYKGLPIEVQGMGLYRDLRGKQ
jgi:hypothetical protein